MTDVMDNVPQILPKELRLGAPPQMPQARSYMFKQPSTLSSYNSSSQQTIQINLPRLQRSYLTKDSYLRFKLNLKQQLVANQGVAFDTCGAYGLFDKIEVFDYLGSTSLESISGHGQLMALLLDLHSDTIEASTHNAIIDGTLGVNPLAGNKLPTTGEVLIPPVAAAVTSPAYAQVTKEYCIPLCSFLGLLSTKYAPLHNGYTILLTLNQPNTAFISFGSGGSKSTLESYTLTEVNLHCQILELGPGAETMLLSSTGGRPMVVHTKTLRRYTGTVKAQPEFRLPLNLNVSSLTNILWFMRSKTDVDAADAPSLGNRIRAFLQNWYFQYGSSVLPQTTGINAMASNLGFNGGNTPIVGGSTTALTPSDFTKYYTYSQGYKEAYAELLKSRHGWDTVDHKVQLSPLNFEWDQCWNIGQAVRSDVFNTSANAAYTWAEGNIALDGPYTTGGVGKFACGLDLELVNGKSANMICGLNTNGMNTMIAGRFHPDYYNKLFTDGPPVAISVTDLKGATSVGTVQDTVIIDAFAEYDAYINISPGIATTVSF